MLVSRQDPTILSLENTRCKSLLESGVLTLYLGLVLVSFLYGFVDLENKTAEMLLVTLFFVFILPTIGYFAQLDLSAMNVRRTIKKGNTEHRGAIGDHYEWKDATDFLFQYALNSFLGLSIVVTIAFFLGFFIQDLSMRSLNAVLLSFGVLNLFWALLRLLSSNTNKNFVVGSDNTVCSSKSVREWFHDEKGVMQKPLILSVGIFSLIFVSRFPVLLVGGIVGTDTWLTSALAMNIVVEGKILFIGDIIGIFEFLPSDKAVVAPLILALGSIFSGSHVLAFQYLLGLWLAFIGFLFLLKLFFVFLESFFSKDSTQLVFGLSFVSTTLYYTTPIVVCLSDGFLSGRTLVFVFLPLFFLMAWQWFSEELNTRKFIFRMLLLSTFLLSCHRMSGLIIFPFVLVLFMFRLMKNRLKSGQNCPWHQVKVILPLLLIEFLVLIFRILLYLFWSYKSWTPWFESNYFSYVRSQEFLQLVHPALVDHVKFMLSLSIVMGWLFPLFLLELLLGPLLITFSRKEIETTALTFYIVTKLSILANIFMIYQAPFFFQAILHIIVLHATICGYLIYICFRKIMNRRLGEIQNAFPHFNARIFFILFVLSIFLFQAVFSETARVIRNIEIEEPYKGYLSQDLIDMAGFISQKEPILGGRTVVSASSTVSLKLSALLPQIPFIPNHKSQYAAYGYLDDLSYEFDIGEVDFRNLDRIVGLMIRPIVPSAQISELDRQISLLLNENITCNENGDLLRYFNVGMLIIPRVLINGDLPLLFRSALIFHDPAFSNRGYFVILLSMIEENNRSNPWRKM